jgi:alkylhydroperoxidase family enzyme
LRNECDAPRVLREIAILRASILVGCAYEEHHHRPLAAAAGLTQEQVDAIKDWRPKAHLFDDRQQALLAYVDQLGLNKGDVDDATFAAMEKHFSPQEMVELTMCATSYYGGGLFMKAMRIQMDDPHKKAAPGKF